MCPMIQTMTEIQAGKLPRVILISKKSTTPPLYKALSTEYKDRLLFGEVKSSSGDIADKLNITDVPAIIIIAKDGRRITYEGKCGSLRLAEISCLTCHYQVK